MNAAIDARLREVVASVLAVDAASVRDDDSPRTIAAWDSVAHIGLMLAVEAEFGVEFAPDEIATLASVGLIRARLEAARA